jgi:hypothetical protein
MIFKDLSSLFQDCLLSDSGWVKLEVTKLWVTKHQKYNTNFGRKITTDTKKKREKKKHTHAPAKHGGPLFP